MVDFEVLGNRSSDRTSIKHVAAFDIELSLGFGKRVRVEIQADS